MINKFNENCETDLEEAEIWVSTNNFIQYTLFLVRYNYYSEPAAPLDLSKERLFFALQIMPS